jgi:hypothetical protein
MDVAAQMAQVAIRFLGIGVQCVLVGTRSSGTQQFQLLIRVRRVGYFGRSGRRRGDGRKLRLLGAQVRDYKETNGYQGSEAPTKFVTFSPKYVTKENNLLVQVAKITFARGCYRTRLQAKTVAWMFGCPQEELLKHAVADKEQVRFE